MQRLFILLLTLFIAVQTGHSREYSKEELTARRNKFQNMKTTGWTLAGIGAAMVVGGGILMANGKWEQVEGMDGQTRNEAQDGAAIGGTILLMGGIPMTVGGIIFGAIGSKKVRQYDDLLESASLGFEMGRDRRALRLSYSF